MSNSGALSRSVIEVVRFLDFFFLQGASKVFALQDFELFLYKRITDALQSR